MKGLGLLNRFLNIRFQVSILCVILPAISVSGLYLGYLQSRYEILPTFIKVSDLDYVVCNKSKTCRKNLVTYIYIYIYILLFANKRMQKKKCGY